MQGNQKRINSVIVACHGDTEIVQGTNFISSMPVTECVKKLDPPPPPAVLHAAEKLNYRDFLYLHRDSAKHGGHSSC